MAIEISKTDLTIVKTRRTWRVEIFSEKDTDPEIRVWRETVLAYSDGSIRIEKDAIPIIKKGSEIVGQSDPAIARLPEAIALLADAWDKEQLGL